MDIFQYREDLVGDYSAYVKGFLEVRDADIEQFITSRLDGGFLWPEPLVQLNPAFVQGPTIDELVDQKRLHPTCREIFRRGKTVENPLGAPLRLHRHQEQAINCAQQGGNYVLTTGTGSGKSLAYLIPIIDHVLKVGAGHGIQAIVVYPMNALANSQLGEMDKFLGPGFPTGKPPVRFDRYTGQENEEARDRILNNPPDVLLTNYVMLELILTRPREREHLIKAAGDLKFLVLDELHTYRGRQGADVSMLVRRLRETLKAEDVICVGTSATMGTGATFADVKRDVADVATRLFGAPVSEDDVIGERLRRITPDLRIDDPSVTEQLSIRVKDSGFDIPTTFDAFCKDPMASWVETTFGLEKENDTEYLKRATPKTLRDAGMRLSEKLGLDQDACAASIQRWLLHGYNCEPDPISGNRPFAFRLHQFISKGDAVYATLGNGADRWMTLQPQLFRPEHREERIYPLAFCRACGQEFYSVYLQDQVGGVEVFPRPAGEDESKEDHIHAGYLMVLEEPWPADPVSELELLPDEWKETFHGAPRLRADRRDKRPIPHMLLKDGTEGSNGIPAVFLSAPFCFCPNCRVTYSPRQRKDFGKLATLSSEGRSTATTVLSLAAIRHLKSVDGIEAKAQKLLSFTDNRQDASLQAGHFNDFAETGLLRAALYQAVHQAGSVGLTHDKLSHAVFEVLNLPFGDYSVDPTLKFAAKDDTKQVLRDLLAYRLYRDLRRGWRINLPNLEQVGLLALEYKSLADLCAAEEEWAGKHRLLVDAAQEDRTKWCRTLLDVLRRELAIKVDYLRSDYQDQLKQRSNQRLKEPWSIDEDEQMDRATLVLPESSEEMAMLRPLGGGDMEVTGILRGLEEISPAQFEYPIPEQAGDYRSSRMLRDALRLGFRASAGPFRSFGHLNFEPRPYQLVPLLMGLKQDPVRLLIADDVGIGKTIEAGLLAKELLDRGEVTRMVVLCPPHLAEQWQRELKSKFQIDAELVLAATARRLESECRGGESLFDHFPFTIVSLDYIKSDHRRDDFLRTCPELVIVDEAHTCAFAGRVSSAQHQRHLLLRKLAENKERHLILVTATPHSGNEDAFRSLLAVLDPVLANLPTDLGGDANRVHREHLAVHLVQRKRGDIEHYLNTDTPFPKRQDAEQSYALSPEYRAFFKRVLSFVRESVQDKSGTMVRRRVRWWSALALLRSMASSPAAAAATLTTRAANLEADTEGEADEQGRSAVMDIGDDRDSLTVSDIVPGSDLGDADDEGARTRRRLLTMAKEALSLYGKPDTKLDLVTVQVKQLLEEGFNPIVFCRFIPTAEYIADHLRSNLKRQFADVEVAAVTGLLAPADREDRIDELSKANRHVLVATDCLSEGINLQDQFDAVVHYDLSWNPTRHEQREGRVDRFGQQSKSVKVLTLFGKDNQIDGIVLDVLLRKHKRIRSSLGISVPVPATSDEVLEAVFEGLVLRGLDSPPSQEQLLPGFEDYFKPQTQDLYAQWDAAGEREKKSRTIFAQHGLKTEEVHMELEAARQAIGMGVDVETFVHDALEALGAGWTRERKGIRFPLKEGDGDG